MIYNLFNGVLNNMFLGIALYWWIILILFLILVFSYAIWFFFFWTPLKPLHGHFVAHLKKIGSAFIFNVNLNFRMTSEKRAKLIFDISVEEAKKLQKDWKVAPSGLIGRVLTDLIFDGGAWTDLESPIRAEIERIASVYNDLNPDDQIMTLSKFWQRADEGKLGECKGIELYYVVPWLRINSAFPKDHNQTQWGGYLRQLSAKQDKEEGSKYDTYAYGFLILSGLICAGMLLNKFFGH